MRYVKWKPNEKEKNKTSILCVNAIVFNSDHQGVVRLKCKQN